MSDKVYENVDEFVANVKGWIGSKNRNFFAREIDGDYQATGGSNRS